MNRVKLALLAVISIAMAFTFSCSGDGNNNEQPFIDSSSSSEFSSSSVSSSSEELSSSSEVLSSSSSVGESSSSSDESSSSSVGESSSSGDDPSSSSVEDPSSSSSFPLCGTTSYDPLTHFCDVRGVGKTYKWVKIGEQTWMAENLNFDASGSKCGGADGLLKEEDTENCDTYGRLYNWNTAMNNAASSTATPSGVRGVCPEGWHLPSNAEWDALYRFADGTSGTDSPYDSPTAGKVLKSKDGWYDCGPSGSGKLYLCEDTYGFSALPGGNGSGGYFYDAGIYGTWWSATQTGVSNAYRRGMNYNIERAFWNGGDKFFLFSVRCLKDLP
ncbi:MAG: hypothetical protein LBU89_03995 [Fibromonadaceae bacterium]|jgi:uncharacterized protein (TIGR02145 family)|nr:hypothetical protein [Fibromonadaceae bacterium]